MEPEIDTGVESAWSHITGDHEAVSDSMSLPGLEDLFDDAELDGHTHAEDRAGDASDLDARTPESVLEDMFASYYGAPAAPRDVPQEQLSANHTLPPNEHPSFTPVPEDTSPLLRSTNTEDIEIPIGEHILRAHFEESSRGRSYEDEHEETLLLDDTLADGLPSKDELVAMLEREYSRPGDASTLPPRGDDDTSGFGDSGHHDLDRGTEQLLRAYLGPDSSGSFPVTRAPSDARSAPKLTRQSTEELLASYVVDVGGIIRRLSGTRGQPPEDAQRSASVFRRPLTREERKARNAAELRRRLRSQLPSGALVERASGLSPDDEERRSGNYLAVSEGGDDAGGDPAPSDFTSGADQPTVIFSFDDATPLPRGEHPLGSNASAADPPTLTGLPGPDVLAAAGAATQKTVEFDESIAELFLDEPDHDDD